MNELPRYGYRVFWSPEDAEYVATCHEIPGLSGLGETPEAAIAELMTAMEGWLDHLRESGGRLPEPSSELRNVVQAMLADSMRPPRSHPNAPGSIVAQITADADQIRSAWSAPTGDRERAIIRSEGPASGWDRSKGYAGIVADTLQ